jgi:tellurite resistance protein TerC
MPLTIWILFIAFIIGVIFLDLGVFHRKAHVIGLKEALGWTGVWVALALVFTGVVYYIYEHDLENAAAAGLTNLSGHEASIQYLTGYLIEKSLSVDNIFVIALIFTYFQVPLKNQHRVLFWGILGAVVLRGVMIAAGAALIHRFEWIVYVFGLLLIASAIKLMITESKHIDPEKNFAIRLTRRFYPVSPHFDGAHFFTKMPGDINAVTPLFLALVMVETSDVMFAVDSIPAIFAITRDPFLVFTSNIFAILGLRSLYFALAGLMDRFRYLETSLVVLLFYVGIKTLLSHTYPIPNVISLSIITVILTAGVVASLMLPPRGGDEGTPTAVGEAE